MPVWWQTGGIALGLGALLGFEAALLSSLLYRIEDLFHRLPVHWMWWPAIGGVGVGIGGLIDAHVLGAGYSNIQALLDGTLVARVVLALLVVKAVVWLVALGSGTSGGVLAPLLILGGALGALVGHFLPGAIGFWALLGMAGIMSGAMRAPLPGAIFVVELTGDPDSLPGDMRIRAAVEFFAEQATHRSYPVVDKSGRLLALVSRSDALRWQVEGDRARTTLTEALSDASQPFAFAHSPIGEVADLMVDTGIGRLPIVDAETRRVVGILSRHDLLKARSAGRRAELGRYRGTTSADHGEGE